MALASGGESDVPRLWSNSQLLRPSGQQCSHSGGVCPQIQGRQCGAYVGAVEEMMCVVCVDVTEGAELLVCGGGVRSILLLPLVARCLETIDVCIWRMFVFMSVVVTVWGLWECLLCSGRC